MGSTGRPTMQSLQLTLEKLLENQVTKQHFDDKINGLENRIDKQDEAIKKVDEKVEEVKEDMAKLPDTMYKEMHEQELRKKCAITFGLKEQSGRNEKERHAKDKDNISRMLRTLNDINLVCEGNIGFGVQRLGKFNPDAEKPRPLKISFSSNVVRDIVLTSCKHLKGQEEWNGVSVVPDLTKVQQRLSKIRRADLQKEADKMNGKRKEDETDKFHYKVLGHYGLGNLRVVKINNVPTAEEDDE